MAEESSMVHVRMDARAKAQAISTLAAMGLSISEAVRMFLHQIVVEQAFPLKLRATRDETASPPNKRRRK